MKDSIDRGRRGLLLGLAALPVAGYSANLPTPAAAEGPFYPLPSMRFQDVDNDLVKVAGTNRLAAGEIVNFGGYVLDRGGKPVPGARIEIWQCDFHGRYLHSGDRGGAARDAGFQGFGHDVSGIDGAYSFRTIRPVPYPGRTPHIHARVLIAGRERLTTQFYLPDHPGNARDWLYQRIEPERRESVTLDFDDAPEPGARLDIIV